MTRNTKRWVIGGSVGAVALALGYGIWRRRTQMQLGPGGGREHEEHERHGERERHEKHKKHGRHENERGEYGERRHHKEREHGD